MVIIETEYTHVPLPIPIPRKRTAYLTYHPHRRAHPTHRTDEELAALRYFTFPRRKLEGGESSGIAAILQISDFTPGLQFK